MDGPIHGLICHASRKSRPCLKALLGEGASCAFCLQMMKPRWIGFVPVRREDGRPWIIAIGASRFEVADGIKPGSRVSWGRDDGTGQGVWILPRDKGAEWRVYYPDIQPVADLCEPLATLWETPALVPDLRRYFAEQCQSSVTAEPVEPPADSFPVDAPPELVRIDRERRAKLAERDARLGSLDDAMPRLTPKKNGTH
jgi:hypothetical protein